MALTLSNLNQFQNYFTCRQKSKFVIRWLLKIQPHLKCVPTLPCEIFLLKGCLVQALNEANQQLQQQQQQIQQQQQQPFYGPLSGTTLVSRYQKKHSPTHHPDHHPIFISFFHLPRSVASSLFKLRAWQSFCTTSLHVLFGLPLDLQPSTSYSIHFFTQSVSSFHNTCPYHCNLFCCSIKLKQTTIWLLKT